MKSKSLLTNKFCVFLLAVFCCLLWGSATPSIKTGYKLFQIASEDTMSQMLFAGVRFTLAGVLAVLFASLMRKRILVPKRSSLPLVFKLALVQTILQYIFFYVGLAHTTGVRGAIIGALSTFFSILFAVFLFRQEKLTGRKVLGCLLGFAGVVLINITGSGFGGASFWGDGAMVISTAASALSFNQIKVYSQKEDPVILNGWQFILGGCVLIAVGLLGHGTLRPVSGAAWLLMLYMGFLSAAAYSIWSLLLKYNDVSHVTIYSFTNPIFGVLLSELILRETNSFSRLQMLAALALVCAGILIINLPKKHFLDGKGGKTGRF